MNKIKFLILFTTLSLFFSVFCSELDYLKIISEDKNVKSNFYGLYNFVKDFFCKYNIKYPLNLEFSVKISDEGIDTQRYIISIPRTYFNGVFKDKLDDITAIIPNECVKNKIKNLILSNNVGSLIYAIDFFDGQKKYKVYFDFPVVSGKGISSFEWKEGESDFIVRDYKPINFETFKTYLDNNLSLGQKKSFVSLERFLDFNKILFKEGGNKTSACIKFKNNTLVKDVKNQLEALTKDYKKSHKFSLFLDKIKNLKISWIHFQKGEIAIYTRLNDWIYYV